MASIYENGGMIGVTMDFGSTEQYVIERTSITYVGSASSDNSTTIDLSGISMLPGDIVLVISADDTGAPGTATGYTSLDSFSGAVDTRVMYKVMSDPVDSSVTGLTAGGSDSGHLAVVFRGVDTTTPIDVTTTSTSGSTDSDLDPPSITTVTDGATVVAFVALDDDLITTVTPPSGYTLADFNTYGSSGSGGSVMAVYKEVTTAGTEDPGSIITDGNDAWYAATVALRPLIVYGNYKNSGVWNLTAVYETLYIPEPLEYTDHGDDGTTTGGTQFNFTGKTTTRAKCLVFVWGRQTSSTGLTIDSVIFDPSGDNTTLDVVGNYSQDFTGQTTRSLAVGIFAYNGILSSDTIQVNFNISAEDCHITIVSIDNLVSTTATSSDTDGGSVSSVSLTPSAVSTGGLCFAIEYADAGSPGDQTLTGFSGTEIRDTTQDNGFGRVFAWVSASDYDGSTLTIDGGGELRRAALAVCVR